MEIPIKCLDKKFNVLFIKILNYYFKLYYTAIHFLHTAILFLVNLGHMIFANFYCLN